MTSRRSGGFRHDAFLYTGEHDFVDGIVPFIHDGLAREEPILVAVEAPKIDLVRHALGREAGRVAFADMRSLGRKPALIIPAWRQFVAERPTPTAGIRGVGEPIWPGRSGAELVECQHHERLLNFAFADTPAFRLLCPYDGSALDETILGEALHSHPGLTDGRRDLKSRPYGGLDAVWTSFAAPLPDPPPESHRLAFRARTLQAVRAFVHQHAKTAELGDTRTAELVLAVNEVVTNSLRHGGGGGTLTAWRNQDGLICEVRDRGRITSPLVGRQRPTREQEGGRGLWLANQLCDLVQIRSSSAGSVVRLFMRR